MDVVYTMGMAAEPVVNTTNRQAPGLCFRSAASGHHHRVSAVISRRLAQEPRPPLTCRAGECDYGLWPVTDMDAVLVLKSGIDDIPILDQTSGAITLTTDEEKRVPLTQPVILYPDHTMQVAPFYRLLADLHDMDDIAGEDNSPIRYVEGTRALTELSTLVDQGLFKAVIVQFPPSVKRILVITDLGRTMPEKSFLMITEPNPHLILSALR